MTKNRMRKGSIRLTFLFLVFLIFSFLPSRSSWAITCSIVTGTATCTSTTGYDTITIFECLTAIPPNGCDGMQDVTVSDQDSSKNLIDITQLNVIGLEGDDNFTMDLTFGVIDITSILLLGDISFLHSATNRITVVGQHQTQDLVKITTLFTPFIGNGGIEIVSSTPTNFFGMDSVTLRGNGGNDILQILGSSSADNFLFTPGSTTDSGDVLASNPGIGTMLVSFSDLGSSGQIFLDGGGGTDTLSYQGTEFADILTMDSTLATDAEFFLNNFRGSYLPLSTMNVSSFIIETLGSQDGVQIDGPFLAGDVTVDGGGQPNDLLIYNAGGANPVEVDSFTQIQETTGKKVAALGMSILAVDAGNADLSVIGFVNNQEAIYTPQKAPDGQVDSGTTVLPLFLFTNAGSLTLDSGGAIHASLSVPGTPSNDTITVDEPGATPFVEVTGLQGANFTGFELLTVTGLSGDDTFNVSPLTSTTMVLDGGPHGFGDTLNFDGLGLTVNATSSSISATGKQPVAYFNMENVNIDNATFANPPPGGTVNFTAAVFRNFENDVLANITVTRTGTGVGEVNAHYSTSNGSGVAGTDYAPTSGVLHWNDGQTGDMIFTVPLINQDSAQGEKTVKLSLSMFFNSSAGAVLGNPATALLIIEDTSLAPKPTPTASPVKIRGNGGGCSLQPALMNPEKSSLIILFSLAMFIFWLNRRVFQ